MDYSDIKDVMPGETSYISELNLFFSLAILECSHK